MLLTTGGLGLAGLTLGLVRRLLSPARFTQAVGGMAIGLMTAHLILEGAAHG